jgi:nucleosome assembly protein 1-like 1
MIQEHDEEVLTYLQNIKVVMNDTKPYGFSLEFHFAANEFFTNQVLYKSYELTCEKDAESPLQYDGPVMYKCKGCTINWNKGFFRIHFPNRVSHFTITIFSSIFTV